MSSENASNVSGSARTSPPAPPSSTPQPTTAGEYLDRQQELARAALGRVVREMGEALKDGANLAQWTRQYPWIITGSAVVGGFVAGLLVTPARDETFKEKYETLRDKLTRQEVATEHAEQTLREARKETGGSSWVGSLFQQAFKAVGPLLSGVIASQMQQPSDGDGAEDYRNIPPMHEPDDASDNPRDFDH